ncbi:MAG: glycosyltransferase family 9 protein [Methylacidiphilales bacterium]|nr:glycosyltransferase family 9 protein [Candidatus Methylacidiphilales bacterium]
MKKCLVIELWWIGDATLMTAILQGLQSDGWEITILAKTQTRNLLETSYPSVKWIEFDAPWTAFYGKYKIWRWPWATIARILREIRSQHFAAAVSIRKDPRQHFFVWLTGIPRRIGFDGPASRHFLSEAMPVRNPNAHRVEDWWQAQKTLSNTAATLFPPKLSLDPALRERYRALFQKDPRPAIAIHCGARNAVRRWPESHFRELILRMRREFDFQLVLLPDLDGYGSGLKDLAENILQNLSIAELLAALANLSLLICNDSGPSHLADAVDTPTITIFGPGDPQKLRPFRPQNLIIIRDICPYHPCSDYCRYPEPFCLTRLDCASVWPEIKNYLIQQGRVPLQTSSTSRLTKTQH